MHPNAARPALLQSGAKLSPISRVKKSPEAVNRMPASAHSALVLTVDGLHSGFLGPYGNTWIQTPEFDALAAEGFVFDQAMIAHPRLDKVFDALWSASRTNAPAGQLAVSLAQVLTDAEIATCLITDDASIAGHPLATGFAECVLLAPLTPLAAARDIGETGLAQALQPLPTA